jgi:hypothetical protein
MLATHCAICGRPLVDAKSVECGIGPECRRRHGYDVQVSEDARAEANGIVYGIALSRSRGDDFGPALVAGVPRLRVLGLARLADVLSERAAIVTIAEGPDGRLAVRTPYGEAIVEAMRGVPGRRWDREAKVNTFPAEAKGALWTVLRQHFNGAVGLGPKGLFVIT